MPIPRIGSTLVRHQFSGYKILHTNHVEWLNQNERKPPCNQPIKQFLTSIMILLLLQSRLPKSAI